SEVNHRRRNQKGECNAKRQTCACKPDKQRNGRTRAKRCYRTEQSGDDIRPYSVKSAEYLFSSFGREITLNIRDNQNQNAEQYHNFYSIIDEKLNTSSYFARGIYTASVQKCFNEAIQPVHTKDFILKKVPNCF